MGQVDIVQCDLLNTSAQSSGLKASLVFFGGKKGSLSEYLPLRSRGLGWSHCRNRDQGRRPVRRFLSPVGPSSLTVVRQSRPTLIQARLFVEQRSHWS